MIRQKQDDTAFSTAASFHLLREGPHDVAPDYSDFP